MSTTDLTAAARAYRELQAEMKALQEQADALKAAMIAELDAKQADSIQAGEYTIRHTVFESTRVDTAKLKASGMYAQFSTSGTALRFSVA